MFDRNLYLGLIQKSKLKLVDTFGFGPWFQFPILKYGFGHTLTLSGLGGAESEPQ